MPYAKNGDINIYYEVEGEGPPLLLHHSFSTSLESWRDRGYVDALKKENQLILFDARGHGKSDKPHNPEAYSSELRVGDITAVLDALGIPSTNYFGYSMGGNNGFSLAKYAPERVKSLILGGSGARPPNPEVISNMINLLESGAEEYLANREQNNDVSPGMRAVFLSNDYKALSAIWRNLRSNLEDDLPKMTMPFLLFAGESDFMFAAVKEAHDLLPNSRIFSLPGLDHGQTFQSSDLVLPHVKEFLARVNK